MKCIKQESIRTEKNDTEMETIVGKPNDDKPEEVETSITSVDKECN
jgi:hypothetical protein